MALNFQNSESPSYKRFWKYVKTSGAPPFAKHLTSFMILKIPLVYPSLYDGRTPPLKHLQSLLEKRVPSHRKGFYFWALISPLTVPFIVIRMLLLYGRNKHTKWVISSYSQFTVLLLCMEVMASLQGYEPISHDFIFTQVSTFTQTFSFKRTRLLYILLA